MEQDEKRLIVDGIFEMIDTMIGALESGFINSPSFTIAQLHQVAKNHALDTYGIEIPSLRERHGEDVASLCATNGGEPERRIAELKRQNAELAAEVERLCVVQGEPVAYQYKNTNRAGGKWVQSSEAMFNRVSESTDHLGGGYEVRALYAAPQPAPDASALVEALEDIAGTHHYSASAGEYFAKVARKALATHRKGGEA